MSVTLALLVGAAVWWFLPDTTPTGTRTADGAAMTAPWVPTSTRPSVAGSSPPDAGKGWTAPTAGTAGPSAATDLGVPYGYAHDHDGAALAAVNAVVGARYLVSTFADPWEALGFLADPRFAGIGGNTSLEEFFSGPAAVTEVGGGSPPTDRPTPSTTTPAPAVAGGARVLGAQVTDDPTAGDAVRVVVLWQRFSRQGDLDQAGHAGYTVVIDPVSLQLVWVAGDWKVSTVSGPPPGMAAAVVVGVVPADYPIPAEDWRR